jgi:osmotically-inducible protein OsmY
MQQVDKTYSSLFAGGVIALAVLALSGCAGVFAGAAATAGIALAQERTVGEAVDDKAIQLRINEGLFYLDAILFGQIDVEVVQGRVLLTGSVGVADDRVRVAQVTWKVDGVKEVLNEVQVTNRGGLLYYLKDAKITTQLRYLMLRDKEINDINFSVETVNGVVYLMGIAISQSEIDKLTNHARNIAGVVKVINHVRQKEN